MREGGLHHSNQPKRTFYKIRVKPITGVGSECGVAVRPTIPPGKLMALYSPALPGEKLEHKITSPSFIQGKNKKAVYNLLKDLHYSVGL